MRDGRVKHVQERVVTHYGAKGAPTTTLGTVHDITEQKMAELTLKEAERRWVMALEGAGHGVWDWDTRSNRVFYSETWKEMLGFTENEIGPHVSEWRSRIHPDDQAAALAVLKQHFNGASDTYRSEHRLRCRDGSYKWILDQGMVFERSVDRQPIRVVGTHTDITQSKQAQLQLEQNHRMITGLLKNTSDAYIAVDAQYRVGYFNQAAERLWNISSSEVVGASLWDALPELASFFYLAFTKAMSHGRPYTTEGYYPPLSKTLDLRLYPWENGLWAFFQDISDRKAAESRLKRLASTDAMTGAYNRMRLSEILRAEIRRASRYHTLFSLVMLDIDHFKEVNDTFGHAVGDQVILGVVERISRILRGSDSLGRWGGEEFVILLPQTSLEAACNKAERCRQAVANTPFATADQVTISLGVAAYKPGLDFDELLDEADKRLYRAKASGRNRVVCGEPPIPPPQATPSDGFETPETPQDP
jgi:diguanylate cyclase (GGDEF)-like protein/PAS domain S-box-containing protein